MESFHRRECNSMRNMKWLENPWMRSNVDGKMMRTMIRFNPRNKRLKWSSTINGIFASYTGTGGGRLQDVMQYMDRRSVITQQMQYIRTRSIGQTRRFGIGVQDGYHDGFRRPIRTGHVQG
eukprot:scaffold4511_cov171-Amphora_coffeaeformis.AAC.5